MDKLAYSLGVKLARAQHGLEKVAVPLWAFPAAAAGGAAIGALTDDVPWMGALKGGVLAPAALLGGAAAFKHGYGASKNLAKGLAYGAGGALGAGGATYGMGALGLGPMADMVRAGQAQRQQATTAPAAYQGRTYPSPAYGSYYPQRQHG